MVAIDESIRRAHDKSQAQIISCFNIDGIMATLRRFSEDDFKGGGDGRVSLWFPINRGHHVTLKEYSKKQIADSLERTLRHKMNIPFNLTVFDFNVTKPKRFMKGSVKVTCNVV